MVVYAFNPSTQEAEAGGWRPASLIIKTCLKKKKRWGKRKERVGEREEGER